MRKILPFLFIVFILQGCEKTRNEILPDSQIPPDGQLIKISADELAKEFTRGKKRSLNQDNDADKKFSKKWLKVTGAVDSFDDKRDGFGYNIKFDTFAGDPSVECGGNYEDANKPVIVKKNQEITVVGKLVNGGNASTLYLIPCKVVE